MRTLIKQAALTSAVIVSVSALTLAMLTPVEARPGLGGGGGHPNIGGGGGGHSFSGGGGGRPGGGGGGVQRPHPPKPPPPHSTPRPPKPHPGPKPPPPHPHPHPPHPGPGPHPPRPIPIPVPVPVPWVPDVNVWDGVVTDDVIDDLIYAIPSDCVAVEVNSTQYEQCGGGRWYQVVMQGSQIAYIRVTDPR